MRRTKILATIGPASRDFKALAAMIEAGCNGIRLNFSHGTHAEHAETAELVRAAAERVKRPIALVQDLQGPKIRVRALSGGQLTLEQGASLRVDASGAVGDVERLTVDDPHIVEGVEPGSRLVLGDGEVTLEVTEKHRDHFLARVTNGGVVRSGAGITARGLALPGGLTEKDQADLLVGRELGVDYVAVSFVASPADVADAKEMLAAKGESTPVIAKIERRQALENLEGIVSVADGILVARGDLGIALEPEQVPIAQKRMLRLCEREGVLSITATQMLESMVRNARPTRAETSDVANAILDGSQVVMLSGETAIGVDPPRAVATMARICEETERAILAGEVGDAWGQARPDGSREDALCHAAAVLADELRVRAIVSFTSSGSTALRVAKYRPRVPVIGATPEPRTSDRLALVWGVRPFLVHDVDTLDTLILVAEETSKATGLVQPGEAIVVTAGEIGVPGTTNLIRVANVR